MTMSGRQRTDFAERLARIQSGRQFEPSDVLSRDAQKRLMRQQKAARRKVGLAARLAVPFAFLCGLVAMLAARLGYFALTRVEDLPPAVYTLEDRGVALIAFVISVLMIVAFRLMTWGRALALALGCLTMYYGEVAIAANAPDLWAHFFPADYAASLAEKGRDFRLTPTG